ncbi:hypothetical protein A2U01_0114604, partial [Trifolium medium]|nr:hypothetical protein [Trifolium medium]
MGSDGEGEKSAQKETEN